MLVAVSGSPNTYLSPRCPLDQPNVPPAGQSRPRWDPSSLLGLFPYTFFYRLQRLSRLSRAVLESHKHASIFDMRFELYELKAVCLDGLQDSRQTFQELLLVENAYIVPQAVACSSARKNLRDASTSDVTHSQLPNRTGKTESTKSHPSRDCNPSIRTYNTEHTKATHCCCRGLCLRGIRAQVPNSRARERASS